MTQEEKAKAYDEALERAKDALNDGTISNNTIAYLQDIFPELAESEDEKIRKEIVRFIRMEVEDEIVGNKWIAWFEKQVEKPQGKTAFEAIKEKPADNANKVASAWNNGYSNGYIHAIDKACEWLENHNDYIDVKDGNVTYFDMEKCVKDFNRYMEGGEE